MTRFSRLETCLLVLLTTVLSAAEPTVGFNGWTNVPGVVEGTVATHPVNATLPKPPLGFVVYLPKGYNPADTTRRWPLVVMLLGIGEIGDGTDTAANGHQLYKKMIKHGPLFQVVSRKWDFPCIVVAPQPTRMWNTGSILLPMCEYMKANYRVDANRIYMTGLCDGAIGLLNFAANHIGYLAGIIPIETAALPNPGWAANIRNLPMWEAHCYNDPWIARTSSIAWFDQATKADVGSSDVMSTYPGYDGRPLHVAADSDPVTRKPLNPLGPILTVASATLTNGSSWVAFNSTTFGSATFNTWGGTDARPYAVVTPGAGVVSLGKPNGLYLTHPYAGVTTTRSITIQTPVGFNCTAYFNPATGKYAWQRNQVWDRSKPGKRIFTMFWYQDHVKGWVETYANGDCWNWLFSQTKVGAALAVPGVMVPPVGSG